MGVEDRSKVAWRPFGVQQILECDLIDGSLVARALSIYIKTLLLRGLVHVWRRAASGMSSWALISSETLSPALADPAQLLLVAV